MYVATVAAIPPCLSGKREKRCELGGEIMTTKNRMMGILGMTALVPAVTALLACLSWWICSFGGLWFALPFLWPLTVAILGVDAHGIFRFMAFPVHESRSERSRFVQIFKAVWFLQVPFACFNGLSPMESVIVTQTGILVLAVLFVAYRAHTESRTKPVDGEDPVGGADTRDQRSVGLAMGRRGMSLLVGLPVLPAIARIVYRPIDRMVAVQWLGCGCQPGFNANDFNFQILLPAILGLTAIGLLLSSRILKGEARWWYFAGALLFEIGLGLWVWRQYVWV